ncbi:MAG: SPOR domain-containing protein [Xanthobacteraceae bacterium]|nr:SPOR domain-containing protein [Xanthobacteraceae bacterium]
MADRYSDRYQGAPLRTDNDGYDQPSQQGENDPLAELARLIGQTDPFAGLAPERGLPPRGAAPEEPNEGAPLPSWIQRANHRPPVQPSYEEPAYQEPSYDEAPPALQGHSPYADEAAADASEFLHGSRGAYPDAGHGAGALDEAELDPSRYDEALYGAPDHPAYATHADDGYPADPYADLRSYAAQSEPAPAPRRGGMATVVALVALGVVGTAGAYAYRTLIAAPRSGEAPMIKADAGPNKILPPAQQTGDASGKQIQDRMSAGQGSERLVPREEQPVDVNAPSTQRTGPRIVFPPLTTNPSTPPQDASATPPRPAAVGPGSGLGEPRKVHTVSVRPDQADAAPPAPAPATTRPAASQRAAAPAAPPPAANAPLSLAPQASAPPTRVATTAPATAPGVTSGGYLVQIASQRSEADAQASYRALQGKYPSVLGSRTPLIKRADLGEKGVYYRAMVGPFGSPDEASQFCGSLKSAGGQCVVQRN